MPVTAKRPPGRPKRSAAQELPAIGFQWQATLERQPNFEVQIRQRQSRFILATNVLDERAYPAERLLQEYEGQQQVERGFRFLKAPPFLQQCVCQKATTVRGSGARDGPDLTDP
ncbi:MAG: hypothetical protein ACFBSG_20030 [Leptolyngbyaceae cyanobacterium]